MRRIRLVTVLFLSGTVLFGMISSCKQSHENEVLAKNVEAAGEKEKLAEVENYSFRSDQSTYYIASDGRMKITVGKEPVVREVTIVSDDEVKRNSFNEITEISGIEKVRLQCMARLYSGFFSLKNFKGMLEYDGEKSFGPEKHCCLSAEVDDIDVNFYVDEESSLVKRIVFGYFHPERGISEENIDYGPYEEVNGIKMPSSWFVSRVGARGSEVRMNEVKMNNSIEEGFFSGLDVNIGKVEVSQGILEGNIFDFRAFRNNLMVTTNWRKGDVENAGFRTNDRLELVLNGINTEIAFYASRREIPRSAYSPGAKLMYFDRRGGTHVILFTGVENKDIEEELKPLLPVKIKKVK